VRAKKILGSPHYVTKNYFYSPRVTELTYLSSNFVFISNLTSCPPPPLNGDVRGVHGGLDDSDVRKVLDSLGNRNSMVYMMS
jgi:hypothetical protein